MKLNIILILCLIILSALVDCKEIIKITTANHRDVFQKHEIVFLNFYADWCPFSQMLAPDFVNAYVQIRREFNESQILFARVDCDAKDEAAFCAEHGVTKYPTLKHVRNSKMHRSEYRGARKPEDLVQYVRRLLQDPIVHLQSEEDFTSKVELSKPCIFAFRSEPPNSTATYEKFKRVGQTLQDDCKFYWLTGQANIARAFQGRNNYIVFKPSKEPKLDSTTSEVYDHELNEDVEDEHFLQWATRRCIPIVREITFENAEALTEERLPFLILFHSSNDIDSVRLYKRTIEQELMHEYGKVNFIMADGNKFAHPLQHLGKTKQDLPLIAIDSFQHMYTFSNFDDIRVSGKLKSFVQDLHSGKLHREYHFGPEIEIKLTDMSSDKNKPPESTFKKLKPSSNRYTLLKDEL